MKLQPVCFVLLSIVVLSSTICIKNRMNKEGGVLTWWCENSKDHVADIARAPADVRAVAFAYSDIPMLKNGALTPLAKNLESLLIINCNMEDMEDNALKGLTELKTLVMVGNKLTTMKKTWFEDTNQLITVDIKDNMIKSIDDEVAPLWSNVVTLDMRGNEMKCICTDFLDHMTNLRHLRWQMNPMSMRCTRKMLNWLNEKKMLNENEMMWTKSMLFGIMQTCMDEMAKDDKVDDDMIDKCVFTAMDKAMDEKKIDMIE